MGERNFPEELLYGTLEEKYNYFKEYPLSHPKFSESFRQLIKMINISEDDDSVIFDTCWKNLYELEGFGNN
ncbi:MAG: hypothetical protein ACQEW5_14170 [Bacillota bacterium]